MFSELNRECTLAGMADTGDGSKNVILFDGIMKRVNGGFTWQQQ
jgi:hypothetical protein